MDTPPGGEQHRGNTLNLQDFIKVVRHRWITVAISTLAGVAIAITLTLLTTPQYQASTRLFVSTTLGASATDLYQGNRLSQERVQSYTDLLMGETLAQRTIDKLQLDMDAGTLRERVTARARLNTVLITVYVLDESPVRARDIANALSDEFVTMVGELETPRPGSPPAARVIVEQRASVPESPVVPKRKRNVALGLLLGLLAGIGLAVVRDLLDNTVKDRETLEGITGVGVVGNIPVDKDRRDQPAISFESGHSAIAEAFRKLRTNLQFLAVDRSPRVILITSSNPNEGKSVTAINIALALAEANQNVVIVDGDMRRPSLHSYLGLVGSVGFSTVLSGAVPLSDALQSTRFPRLTALTAGGIPPNPSELLGSLAAKKTLEQLRDQFDYVILDSSPLLAVTDSAILAANADGTLIICRFGKTKREQLAHAVGSLNDVGAPILGAISTMEPMGKGAYYYTYYGYGKDEGPESQSEGISAAADVVNQRNAAPPVAGDSTAESSEPTGQ